jgi:hypothetical protein
MIGTRRREKLRGVDKTLAAKVIMECRWLKMSVFMRSCATFAALNTTFTSGDRF